MHFTRTWISCAFALTSLLAQLVSIAQAQGSPEAQAAVEELGKTDPIAAAQKILEFPGIFDPDQSLWASDANITGTGDLQQVPWSRGAFFTWNPWTIGTYETGYLWLPERFNMFKLNRSLVVSKSGDDIAIDPFYVNKHYDPEKIERAIVLIPGQWRDSWKYLNLLGNAYRVAQKYPELNVGSDKVLMLSPTFMDEIDRKRGAMKKNEITFQKAGWSAGGTVRHPQAFKHMSSFDVLDFYVSMLLDRQQFPNMKTVTVAGHSMGGQTSMHYAMLRDLTDEDARLKYWVGNPGSYVWLNDTRPFSTAKCPEYGEWPYGMSVHKSIPRYGRKGSGKNGVHRIENFLKRRIHFSVSLDDNGHGPKNCKANAQGVSRVCRAAEWVAQRGNSTEGWSKSHTIDFIPGVSHQDYPVIAYYGTLKFLFTDQE